MQLTSVPEQVGLLSERLQQLRRATFRQLTADCGGTYEIIARFLAILELYRNARVSFDQVAPLGDLYVSWTPGEEQAAQEQAAGQEQAESESSTQKADE
jgi:segregation and condensation protein A